jgi:uncharacterized protein (UPF0548 family)
MFLLTRPSARQIDRFLTESARLPLSYGPAGVVTDPPARGVRFDESAAAIGHGPADFERARAALLAWKQFDLGWVELHPANAGVEIGTNVAVLIRHLGFWSLNGCRVVYHVGRRTDGHRFGFAYGTLRSHAESGEELFEVTLDEATGDVVYRIRATSRPRAPLAMAGHPIARLLQARFRSDSIAVMERAVRG